MADTTHDDKIHIEPPKTTAVGLPGIGHSLQYALTEMGPKRSLQTLLKMNHIDGFDCPSCAWPDPDRRKTAEFCENGAKAVAWEATRKRVDAAFFADTPAVRSNFISTLGHGDPATIFDRSPRPAFDRFNTIR